MPPASLEPAGIWSAPSGIDAASSPSCAAFWMNGGRVTSTSACGLEASLATRSTTPPEPPSTYCTLMPVALVKASNSVWYQFGVPSCRPSALYTVTRLSSACAPAAAHSVVAVATAARTSKDFIVGLPGALGAREHWLFAGNEVDKTLR